MMKRIKIMAVLLVIPAILAAAGPKIDPGSDVYRDLKYLVNAGIITKSLDKKELTREEVVKYINNGVKNIRPKDPEEIETPEQIEALYRLVRKFQTDMMEKGQKLSDIQDIMIDLKLKQERLNMVRIENKQDNLLGMIGARINADAAAYMTDLSLFDGKYTGDERLYRPITQYIDLKFSARSGRELYAEAVFRLQNLFGGLWGAQDVYGIRKFYIKGNYDVNFEVGNIYAKLTRLTMWSNDDYRPFEAKLFSDKRDMIKKELYLSDNAWPVTGLKLEYEGSLFKKAGIQVMALAARIQEASKSNYLVSPGDVQAANSLFSYSYDQYLWAARVSSDLSFEDIISVGINFVDIDDIEFTGINSTASSLNNAVYSADAEVNIEGIAKLTGEIAFSNYLVQNTSSPEAWHNSTIVDSALKAGLETEKFNTTLKAEFFVTGNSFTAYAAQSRIYDYYNNYDYLTANNTWNVSEQVPYFILNGRIYPFTRYTSAILSNYYPVGYNLMPYAGYENNESPYGGATPNRQGIKVKLKGKYFDGMIEPMVKFVYSTEIVSYLPGTQFVCPREFLVYQGGAKLKLDSLVFTGGYKKEITSNSYTGGQVYLDANVIDGGFEYLLADKWELLAGLKYTYFAGTEYPYSWSGSQWEYGSKRDYDATILSAGGGVNLELSANATAGVSYTRTIITDNLDSANDFSAQEIDAKVILKF